MGQGKPFSERTHKKRIEASRPNPSDLKWGQMKNAAKRQRHLAQKAENIAVAEARRGRTAGAK